jgi:hypothetical protein
VNERLKKQQEEAKRAEAAKREAARREEVIGLIQSTIGLIQ